MFSKSKVSNESKSPFAERAGNAKRSPPLLTPLAALKDVRGGFCPSKASILPGISAQALP